MKSLYSTLLIGFVVLLSACGKDTGSTESSSPTPTAPNSGAQPGAPTTLKDDVATAINEALIPGQPSKPSLTIDDAISMMLNSNPEIAQAEERVREYSYYTDIAKKKFIPNVEAIAGYSYDEQKNGIQNYSLGFSQVVWDGTYGANVKLNAMRQLAEEQRARSVRRALVVQTVSKYLNLLRAQGGLTSSRSQFESVKRVYSQVGAAWTLGLTDDQTKLEAEVEYKKGELAVQQAEGNTRIACIELLNIIGSPNQRALCSSPEPISAPLVNIPESENDAVKMALENRPEIAIDMALLESARAGKNLARAEFYPKVVLGVQYGVTDSPYARGGGMTTPGISNGFQDDWSVGVTVRIPLFDGGKKKKAAAAAASKITQAEDELESTQRRVATEVLTDLVNLETAKNAIAVATAAEKAATNLFRESQAAYKLGGLSLSDLLVRVAGLTSAQNKTLEAKYNYVQTLINLKTSLGLENQP